MRSLSGWSPPWPPGSADCSSGSPAMSSSPGIAAPPRRIATLLPSATEIVCALGLEDALVAVSHSCDFAGRVESLPRVTRTRVPAGAESREIDAVVRDCLHRGESLYRLDDALL